MNTQLNLETLLPCGEKLKPLLNKSCISDADIKELLIKRGVYIGKVDKKHYMPLLTMSILSPMEFEYLQNKQQSKEDSIKFRTLKLDSEVTIDNLQTIIPFDLVQADFVKDCSDSFQFNTDLSFAVESSNKLVLDYELLRDDVTKDWVSVKSTHAGRVIIEKDSDKKRIVFKNEFTSSETHDVNDKIVKVVKKYLVANGYVSRSTDVFSITSDSFTNKERFAFMLQLANDSINGFLKFEAVKNIEIGPDENATLPNEARWMADSVKNMIINGESLQNIEYIRNSQYHESLILREIEAKYSFKTGSAQGKCIIEYGFPHYFRKNTKDRNFQASIPRVYFSKDSNSNNLTNISRVLLNEFEETKESVYARIKKINSET